MARLESVALGGFYPTPTSVLPRIANLFEVAKNTTNLKTSFMDPCAGEAEAILYLAKGCEIYACELEASRSVKAKKALGWPSEKNLLTGDAFRISFDKGSKGGVSVLFLNPPYDTDPVHGRLEQRFLERFVGALMEGGFLIFVVPFYALKASATLLGREFDQIECFRFPEGEFEVYKQVVLVAKKGPTLFESDPVLQSRVLSWSLDSSTPPVLPDSASGQFKVPSTKDYEMGLAEWRMHEVDMTSLLPKLRPWYQSERRGGSTMPIPGILPDLPVQDLLLRSYPVATPPRPAHIAAGIASGLFNGAKIEANDPATRLPSLLVKGVFDREYRTVEQKLNKDGEVRSIVQVQQPKLVTTILNLETHKYHTLRSGLEASKEVDVSSMGVVDLLAHYGQSLMNVMERQCPITYDPRRDAASVQLAESPRRMFTAQAHATRALVKLLGGVECTKLKRKGRAAILLGEIGSGKSTVALMTAKTIQSKRPLVMCPPHLLESWRNEVSAVLPEAEVRVLYSVTDLESLSQDKSDRMVVSILSRETAKLGHGWVDVGAVCPACGQVLEEVENQAKKRMRCTAKHLVSKGPLLAQCVDYARKLLKYNPTSALLTQLLRGRQDQLSIAHYTKVALDESSFPGFQKGDLDHFIAAALAEIEVEKMEFEEDAKKALVLALLLAGTDDQIEALIREHLSHDRYKHDNFWQTLIWLLEPGSERQEAILAEFKSLWEYSWGPTRSMLDAIATAKTGEVASLQLQKLGLSWINGVLQVDEKSRGNVGLATRLLAPLTKMSRFKWSKECGEILFQAVPEPRRVSLAQHISKRYPDLFDLLVLDEGHEFSSDTSAQGHAAHRLTSLGIPTILQTGTIMNGYAESLFTNMWALSPKFRDEFSRDDKQRFIDRYGYRKRVLEDKNEKGEVVEFGSNSDRVRRTERVVGNSPGVLPLFVLRHLLTLSVTLHKADLAIDLPECKQLVQYVEASSEQKENYEYLKKELAAAIKKDLFDPKLSGRLFGQLAELPSYLDRATQDTGNTDHGTFEVRYPESVGGELVASAEPFQASEILPKEEWMLDLITKELAEGRNVMVFSWHVSLLPRYARIISERIGEVVPILYADKVPTGKRQSWIEKEVIKKKRHILVANPVCVQTGLNNLVHFASEIWMENPGCNPIIFRQAIGRVDRIGQKMETRIFSLVYKNTLQADLYDLLMRKVAVSVSTDGLDPESALNSAGVGDEDYFAGLSIGKQLWAMLSEGAD